ncbi:MbnP family copper-binding protein [Leptothrix ochracea]|uniref:MbnP family copper-binding protein n=1 Tax=Leptothrix ochracea TaxID=735331 RepID=UPI0034E20B5C
MKTLTQTSFALAAIAAALTACGGGTTTTPTTSVSGSVVDGYLSGATVCVDVNKNGKCDAGEPTGTTDVNGAFTISGVTTADAAAAPLVAQVPSTAVDSDAPTTTVGSNFVLSTPAGKTVISPLTTLVHQTMLKDSTKTADTAAADLKATVSSLATTTDVFADYVKGNDTNAHTAARVVANSLKANYDSVTASNGGSAGKDTQVAIALGEVAKQALMSQGTAPNAALPVGSEDPATLRAQIAAQTATAAGATQAVTINFDMVNGASTTVHCGDPITVANTKLYDLTNPAAAPALMATTTAQTTPGQLTDTRFYVANIVLIDAAGNSTPLYMTDNASQSAAGGLALIDFGHNTAAPTAPIACTNTYNTAITGLVAPGTYTGISMTIGVPARSADFKTPMNHVNATVTTSPTPLQNADMAWSWQSGRKFIKIQFRPTAALTTYAANTKLYGTSATADWNVHIGATGCSGDPTLGNETSCTNPNRLGLKFDGFNANSQKIVLDIAQLLQNAELDFTYTAPPGCMSGSTDPDCAPIFKALGLDLATGKTLSGAGVQTVFIVK